MTHRRELSFNRGGDDLDITKMSLLLSKNLKIKLRAQGIGVPTLSRQTHVPRQTIANWMAGLKPQNIEHVKAVADYFKVTVDELCFGPMPRASSKIEDYQDEIEIGLYEVVLRKIPKEQR